MPIVDPIHHGNNQGTPASERTTRYTAIVRERVGKTIVHREAKTFTHRSAALTWAKHREVELENGALPGSKQHEPLTVAELVRWYIENFQTISKWQRSKQTHLELLERHALGRVNAADLTAAQLIDHVRSRRAKGAGPDNVGNDLVWIGVVLRAAKSVSARGLPPPRSCSGCASISCAAIGARRFPCKVSWSLRCTRRGTLQP